jgi:small subunit ribosomal protein S24e
MDIQVIKDKENPLLKRREVIFKISHDGPTPPRGSVIDRLAATMNSMPRLVVIDRMNTEFGKQETIGYAKIYEDEDRAREVERVHILERNKIGAEPVVKVDVEVPEEPEETEEAEGAEEAENTEDTEEAS